jgi:single-strand DNA-binding protein
MASLNRVILLGNLTRDPDIRYTPKGTPVAELGLAMNRVYNSDSGERREEVTFVDVELWGRSAEIAGEYLKKGRPVLIEGRLRLDSWDDKQTGQKRNRLKVVGENLHLLPGGAPRDGGEPGAEAPRRPAGGAPGKPRPAQGTKDPDLEPGPEEDDIPF